MRRRFLFVGLLVVSAGCECEKRPAPPVPDAAVAPDASLAALGPPLGPEVRARVNGVPITGEQLLVRLAGPRFGPRAEKATLAHQEAALQQAILAELQAQKALSLGFGLDVADGGQPDARAVEFRRHELARRYRLEVLLAGAKPSPEEVRAHFEAQKARVQSEYEVQLIAFDSKQDGAAFLAAVQAGRPFDEVAATLYPGAPEPKPWAVQKLTFDQVPPRFAAALEALAPGQVSDLIPDLGEKGWVLKLVSRKTNPELTFEKVLPALTAMLQERRFDLRRLEDEQALRAAATIELVPPPVR